MWSSLQRVEESEGTYHVSGQHQPCLGEEAASLPLVKILIIFQMGVSSLDLSPELWMGVSACLGKAPAGVPWRAHLLDLARPKLLTLP